MAGDWKTERISSVANVTDFVANGSFEALRNNVTYRSNPDYAVLVRLVDHNSGWKGSFVYVDKTSFDFLRKSVVYPGDIIIANVGANAGAVFRAPELDRPMTLGPNAILCRPHGEVLDKDFLFYYLTGRDGQDSIASILGGSAQPKFNKTDFRALQVPVPPVAEQRSIAATLGALDDKIELNRRMNTTLEMMARALFQSWFVDFDPVRIKLNGGKPLGMDVTTAALFPDSFQDSKLGPIPKGWRAGVLGEVVEIFDARRVPLSGREREQRKGPYPYHGASSAMDYVNDYLFDGIYFLMGEDGSVVNDDGTPVTQYVWGKFWVNNHAHVLQGTNGICTEHLLLQLKETNIAAFVTGAVQPKLNQGNMNRIPLVIPPPEIAEAFGALISPLFAKIRAGTDQSRALASLRDLLLPKLLSGELSTNKRDSGDVAIN